jgi:hypothetical protein
MSAMAWLERKVTLRTGLSPDDAVAGLRSQVRTGALFSFELPRDEVPLRGRIEGRHFEVVRRTQFWNSFTPIATGDVAEADGGSAVTVTCSMHLVPFASLVVWTVVSAGLVGGLAMLELLSGPFGMLMILMPALGPAVGWLMWRKDLDALLVDLTVGLTRRVG